MRKLAITIALAASTLLGGTASANIVYTLQNVGLTPAATTLTPSLGTLTGTFTISDNRLTLISADIVASKSVSYLGHTFAGFTYIYGITGANSTLSNGLGQAAPNFRLSSGGNQVQLAWLPGSVASLTINSFISTSSYESESSGGNRTVTSGYALDPPASLPEPASLLILASGILAVGGLARRQPR